MPKIYTTIELLCHNAILTQPQSKEDVLKHLNKITNKTDSSEEEMQDCFADIYPGENYVIQDPKIREKRKALSDRARNLFFDMIADNCLRNIGSNTAREMQILFKVENSQSAIDHNARLRDAIATNDFTTQAQILEERIRELPEFDPITLIHLSDEDLIAQYYKYRAYIEFTTEAENLLKSEDLMSKVSDTTRRTLQDMKNNIDIFSAIKVRFELICDPHYAILDTDKLVQADIHSARTEGFSKCTDPDFDNDQLAAFSLLIASVSNYAPMVSGALLKLALNKDGYSLEQTRSYDPNMVEHAILPRRPLPNIETALNKGNPLICRGSDGTITAYKLENNSVVHTDPAAILKDSLTSSLTSELKNASQLLHSHAADPFWLLTGSSQYRDIKGSVAAFEKLLTTLSIPPEPKDYKTLETTLNKLEKATEDYITHKGVRSEDIVSINNYRNMVSNRDGKVPGSRDLARMKAVLALRNMAQKARQAISLSRDLHRQNTRNAEGAHVDIAGTARMKAKFAYNKKLPGAEYQGRTLNDFHDLGKQIYHGLYGPEGLLTGNPRNFTPQQEAAAKALVAKIVVFDMIQRGRKTSGNTIIASPVEISYHHQADSLLNSISQKINMPSVTPQALQRFIARDEQKKISTTLIHSELHLGKDTIAGSPVQNSKNIPVKGFFGS